MISQSTHKLSSGFISKKKPHLLWKHPRRICTVIFLRFLAIFVDEAQGHRLLATLGNVFWPGDLYLWPTTFELDLHILALDLHTEIQVRMSVRSAVRVVTHTLTHRLTMSKLLHPSLMRGVKIESTTGHNTVKWFFKIFSVFLLICLISVQKFLSSMRLFSLKSSLETLIFTHTWYSTLIHCLIFMRCTFAVNC